MHVPSCFAGLGEVEGESVSTKTYRFSASVLGDTSARMVLTVRRCGGILVLALIAFALVAAPARKPVVTEKSIRARKARRRCPTGTVERASGRLSSRIAGR